MSKLHTVAILITVCLGVFLVQLNGYYFLGLDSKMHQQVLYYLLLADNSGFILLDNFTLFEKRHLLDVKRLIAALQSVFILSGLLSVVIIIYRLQLGIILRNVFMLLLVLSAVLFFLILCAFSYIFEQLHPYLFVHNSWFFSDDSQLILLFPLDYFQTFSLIYIAILSIFFSIGLLRNKTLSYG
jgi:uncharacterized membrane protein